VIWLTWRQHRAALVSGLTVAIAIGTAAAIAGLPMHRAFEALDLPAIHAGTAQAAAQLSLFTHDYWSLGNLPWRFLVFLPALVGVFVGAPLLSRELESGTFRLAWTQSVGTVRWLLSRVALLSIAVAIPSLLLGGVLYWFFAPWAALGGRGEAFATIGTVFAARCLFSLYLGVALGALMRRVVPAMAATAGVWALAEVIVTFWLRLRYLPPLTIRVASDKLTDTNTYMSQWWTDAAGRRLSGAQYDALAQRLAQKGTAVEHWLLTHHYSMWASVQPDSRFWTFQAIETGLWLGLSALLLGVTLWALKRHL
jgi:hypothetical protein